jgi:hypothetical protein
MDRTSRHNIQASFYLSASRQNTNDEQQKQFFIRIHYSTTPRSQQRDLDPIVRRQQPRNAVDSDIEPEPFDPYGLVL